MFQLGSLLIVLAAALALLAWWPVRVLGGGLVRLLGLLLGLAFVVEVYGFLSTWYNSGNNAVYNAFLVLALLITLQLARTVRPHLTRWAQVCAVLALMGYALSIHLRGNVSGLLVEGIVTGSLLISATSLRVLWSLAEESREPLQERPEFWVFLGFLVFHVGSLPLVCLLELLGREYYQLLTNLYLMVQVVAVAQYLLLAKACLMLRRETRTAHG